MSPFFDPRRRSLQISLGSMIARRGALLTLVVRNKSANALVEASNGIVSPDLG